MRHIILLMLLSIASALSALTVSVHSYKFYAEDKPYVDVNIRILANSIKYKNLDNNMLQSSAAVTMYVEEELTKKVVAWEKYLLQSPVIESKKDIVDQRRFFVPTGAYTLHVSVVDGLDSLNTFAMQQKIKLAEKALPSFSDIALITSVAKKADGPMVRNGVYMEPFPFSIVNESQQIMHFYAEFYHKNAGLLAYGIYTGVQPSDSSEMVYVRYKKIPAEDVSVLFFNFDLNKLPTGDYHLKVALIDESKKVIVDRHASFINENFPADIALKRDYNKEFGNSFVGALDSATVIYGLKALAPLLSNQRASALTLALKEGSLNVQKYFLYNFYKQEYPAAPQQAYESYMKVVEAVNNKFYNTVGDGFKSDRGYIYLKYGQPNKVITVNDELSMPPYEIWYYDFIAKTNQNNVRFLFFSPNLDNEYRLLHSTCQGERQNQNWTGALAGNGVDSQGLTGPKGISDWNTKLIKLFNNE